MTRRIFVILATLFLATGILFTSIARTASVKYAFQGPTDTTPNVLGETTSIDYHLPFPGKVLPDSVLWPLKAARDRVWLWLTPSADRKAELNLLFADKRLVSARMLFEREKPEIAFSTLTKAEKYLEEAVNLEEEARSKGLETDKLMQDLAKASLKHQEEIRNMIDIAPDDAKPNMIEVREKYPEALFERLKARLLEENLQPPQNPFEG